jgi:two-component system sensor histidine kinase HydH
MKVPFFTKKKTTDHPVAAHAAISPLLPEAPRKLVWLDFLWLVVLAVLAFLPPLFEWKKQVILGAIGIVQVFEPVIFNKWGQQRGRFILVFTKSLLATLLVGNSGGIPIDSRYYLIYLVPVVSASVHYEIWGTLLWTAGNVAAYLCFLPSALEDYELTTGATTELVFRNLTFFLAAILINRFVMENRRQMLRYQKLAETLAETNRQLAQVQEEARRSERLAALGQLTAGLAHEIRNPLGVIKGSAEMLSKKMRQADPVAAELTGYISSEVNRLNGLVSRFLHFARPLKIEPQLHDLQPVVEQSLRNVERLNQNSRVKVTLHFPAAFPKALLDAGACEQVFTNLFSNAYEAMPEGGELTVTARSTTVDDRRGVEIKVADSGPGIPEELREQIFNPFFTTKKEGVGLGLSIVSKIVDDHHGSIRVKSEEGKGTCFVIFFPSEP